MATAKFSPKIRAAKKSSTRARKKASADGSEFLLMECYTDKRLREFEEAARKLSERTRAKLYGWS